MVTVEEATQVAAVAIMVVAVVMDTDFRSTLTAPQGRGWTLMFLHLHPSVQLPQGWGAALEVVVMVEVIMGATTMMRMRCRGTIRMLQSGR